MRSAVALLAAAFILAGCTSLMSDKGPNCGDYVFGCLFKGKK